MAIARKGTRRITVEEASYRWKVRPEDEDITLFIQLDGTAFWTLRVNLSARFFWQPVDNAPGRWTSDGKPGTVVTPRHVKMAILAGLTEGWDVQGATGRPFFLSPQASREIERSAHHPNYTPEELDSVREFVDRQRWEAKKVTNSSHCDPQGPDFEASDREISVDQVGHS